MEHFKFPLFFNKFKDPTYDFGLRAFGEIYGYLFAAFVLGAGVGPLIMGGGFDATGSYRWVLGASRSALRRGAKRKLN